MSLLGNLTINLKKWKIQLCLLINTFLHFSHLTVPNKTSIQKLTNQQLWYAYNNNRFFLFPFYFLVKKNLPRWKFLIYYVYSIFTCQIYWYEVLTLHLSHIIIRNNVWIFFFLCRLIVVALCKFKLEMKVILCSFMVFVCIWIARQICKHCTKNKNMKCTKKVKIPFKINMFKFE